MHGFSMSDWELTDLAQSTLTGVNILLRLGGGGLRFQFKNKSTGALVPFTAWGVSVGATAPVWSAGTRPWTTAIKTTDLMLSPTAHRPFDIVQIRRNWGYIHAFDDSSAVGILAFSYVPITPLTMTVGGAFVFAACAFALPTYISSQLAASYITFANIV